ncbi:MAG TPA: pyridoxal-phosphate dependent enzyme [Flavobacteriaceae bacterium]|nr:pyridoxal-phosphate dependent enzyme [Flavobacteriaceae bacterium]
MNTFFSISPESANQSIFKDKPTGISIYLKREDLLHPTIPGNKFRKLKYNLSEAKKLGKRKLLTFGGAFSNHISATAAAGKEFGFETIGVIRGEELAKNLNKTLTENSTLKFAISCGMKLHFLTREEYRHKNSEKILANLTHNFGDFYLLPEGGTNPLAIKGCEEILTEEDKKFDYVCCPAGTGGTLAGLINSSQPNQKILGFSVLNADFLSLETKNFVNKNNWEIIPNYHFGGYGKVTNELVGFINRFKKKDGIQLDPIYTGKMMFGIFDLLKKNYFNRNTRILAIHTGGIQGIAGINRILERKGSPKINL